MSKPGLTREQVEKQRDDARVVIVTLSAENAALRAQIAELKERHHPSCNVNLDDIGDAVLDDYQLCTCDLHAREDVERIRDLTASCHTFEQQVTELERERDQARAEGRREGLEEAQRKVQSLCNEEVRCYIQDKTGCDHPDVASVHNGNAARVADNFRTWCREQAAKEGGT